MKHCPKCNTTKDYSNFPKDKNRPNGLYIYCKDCCSLLYKINYEKFKDKRIDSTKKYYNKNKDKDKDKRYENNRQYHKTNINKIRERKKEYRLKNKDKIESNRCLKRYGITLEQKKELLNSQNNSCKICKRNFNNNLKPSIDHNHSTGKIRGILCNNCNTLLGFSRENKEILLLAIKYLESDVL